MNEEVNDQDELIDEEQQDAARENNAQKRKKASSTPSFFNSVVNNINNRNANKENKYRSRKNNNPLTNNNTSKKQSGNAINNNRNKANIKKNLGDKALEVGSNLHPALKALNTANKIKNGIGAIRSRNSGGSNRPNESGNASDGNNDDNSKNQNTNNNLGNVNDSTDDNATNNRGGILSSILGNNANGNGRFSSLFNFSGFGPINMKAMLIGGSIASVFLFILIIIIAVGIIAFFTPFFGLDAHAEDGIAEGFSQEEQDYYDRLDAVKSQYDEEEKEFSEMVITSAFTIMQLNIPSFTYQDMTTNRMREIADLMLSSAENEDGTITYTAKGEEEVKASLATYFKQVDPTLSDVTCQRMAQDVYDYIDNYYELIGKEEETTASLCDSNSYWWPIGSLDTTRENGVLFASGTPESSVLTAYFGGNDSVHNGNHGAIDISTSSGIGVTNVIAAKAGTVVYPTSDLETQFPDNGSLSNTDGGGLGNYVIIEHSDGNYTVYGHMAQGSITVRAGDTVRQGQVIGKMGHSGRSTGAHLHFEVRSGGRSSANRVDPLQFVSIDNPRPGCVDFSLTATSLSRQEFIAKMNAYCTSSGNSNFCNNFANKAGEVYDVSVDSSVNPELVVVTAGTEQGWRTCAGLYNFWGIGIPNGRGCSAGPQLTSMAQGIRKYAETIANYREGGRYDKTITNRYNEREAAGCDPAGHGLPGSLAGMQSVYSWVGNYRYSPGNWGLGGCVYLNIIYGSNYCSTKSVCTSYSNCPSSSATTVCEQNDYTAWQLQEKLELRSAIFGL